jgi:Protein of unknown function (DUF3426)
MTPAPTQRMAPTENAPPRMPELPPPPSRDLSFDNQRFDSDDADAPVLDRQPRRAEEPRPFDRRPAAAASAPTYPAQEQGANGRTDLGHAHGDESVNGSSHMNGAPRSDRSRPEARQELRQERRSESRPDSANGANGSDPLWPRQDAWNDVEQSLDKVVATTRQAARSEPARVPEAMGRATPQMSSAQPQPAFKRDEPQTRSRPAIPDSDWAQGRVPPTQSRTPVNPRPGLDDEDFWRDRGKPAAAAWPQGDDVEVEAEDAVEENRPAGGGWVVTIGWVLFAGIVAGLMGFLYVGRTQVVRTLPGAAPIYASAGLPVNVRGLEFRNVSYKWGIDRKGRPAMTVAGTVVNITNQPQSVPSVAFVFLDATQAELFNWATPIRDTPLQPGKSTSFEARIPAPPDAVANLQLRFAKVR